MSQVRNGSRRRGVILRRWAALAAAVAAVPSPAMGALAEWISGSPQGNWGDANNWTGQTVPGAADTAAFDIAGGTIDLGGAGTPRTIDTLQLATSGLGGATFNNGILRLKTLSQTGTDNFTFNAAVQSTGAGTWALSGGSLNLTSTANSLAGTTINVGAGSTIVPTGAGTVGGANALGGATLNLTGGTFTPAAGLTLTNGFLRDQVYFRNPNGSASGSALIEANNPGGIFAASGSAAAGYQYSLGGFTPNLIRNINVPVTYDNARVTNTGVDGNSGAFSTNAFVAANGSHNNILTLTYGKITVTNPGTYTFGTRSDDGSNLFIDLDGDGDFAGADQIVFNNKDQGYTNKTGSINLAAGSYHIAIGWYQGGCCDNNGVEARYGFGSGIDYNALTVINPSAPIAGTSFSGLVAGLSDYSTTPVNVTDNSTINGIVAASFGTVTVTDGKRLDVTGGAGITINSLKSNGNGVVTIGGGGLPSIVGTNGIDNSIKVLNKTGSGTLTIAAAQNYTGAINQDNGTIQLNGPMTAHGPIGLTGGTFNANAAVNQSATVTQSAGTYNATAANSLAGTMNVAGVLNLGNAAVGGGTINLKIGGALNINPGAGNTTTFAGTAVNADGASIRVQSGIANLSGANLVAAAAGTPFFNASFAGKIYDQISPDTIHTDINGFLANNTATNTANLTTTSNPNRLRFASDTEVGNFFGNTSVANNSGNGQWTAVFEGTFTPRVAGNHFFGVEINDDVSSIYVDLDRNGTFDQSEMITQQGCCDQRNGALANLTTANVPYKFLLANRDTGGGGSMSMTVAEPGGGRLFAAPGLAPGGGTIQVDVGTELRARTVNGFNSIQLSGSIGVPASAGRLTLGAGTVGAPLASATPVLNVSNQGAIDVGANHTFTVGTLNYTGAGTLTKAGAGTLKAGNTSLALNQTTLAVTGGVMDLRAATLGYTPGAVVSGLFETVVPGDFNEDPFAVNTTRVTNGTVQANSTTGWAEHTTTIYTGKVFVPASGRISFAESFDDAVLVKIDGAQVLRNTQWDNTTGSGALTLTPGYHDFEARFGQGTGGAGPSAQDGWTDATLGFGVDLTDPVDNNLGLNPGDPNPVQSEYTATVATLKPDGTNFLFTVQTGDSSATIATGSQLIINGMDAALPVVLGTGGSDTTGPGGTLTLFAKGVSTTQAMSALSISAGSAGTLEIQQNNVVSLSNLVVPSNSQFNKTGVGVLTIVGNNAGAAGKVVVQQGTLNGSGTLAGPIQVNAGANLAPGTSPGVLSTGSATLDAGANLQIELGGTTLGTQYDQLNVTGAVTLTGSNLVLSLINGFTPSAGQQFTIINNDAADAVAGTFAQPFVDLGGVRFNINYAGGTGNDVVLTASAVPEPTTVGLLGLGALGLLARRRRRQRATDLLVEA